MQVRKTDGRLKRALLWFTFDERTRRRHIRTLGQLEARTIATRDGITSIVAASTAHVTRLAGHRQDYEIAARAINGIEQDMQAILERLDAAQVRPSRGSRPN